MAPNKIDKEFKDKLEERTIQPSEMAWDRLDAMLSVNENKKPAKKRVWMYMAAAFLVFFLVGALLLNQEKEATGIENNNSIVITQGEPETTTKAQPGEDITAPEVIKETAVAESLHNTVGATIQAHGTKKQQLVSTTDEGIFIEKTPEAAVNNIVPTDDANKLLADAVADATPKKKKSTIKVDPNSLLSAVEEELDDSFKTKVLIGTVENFKAVRSAVANRNYQ